MSGRWGGEEGGMGREGGGDTRSVSSPGPGRKGVLDPVIRCCFYCSLYINTGRLPRGLVQPILLPLSFPYLPSIGVKRCFSPRESEPEAPPKWLSLPPVLELLPPRICDFGANFLHLLAHVLELLPPRICDFGAPFLHFLAPVWSSSPLGSAILVLPFCIFGSCFGAPPP